jgi:5-methyltetrahydropteroyltriglutamate--homocysteine methyltransferase
MKRRIRTVWWTILALNLTDIERAALLYTYKEINEIPNIKIILANYFDCFGENLATALSLQYIPYT